MLASTEEARFSVFSQKRRKCILDEYPDLTEEQVQHMNIISSSVAALEIFQNSEKEQSDQSQSRSFCPAHAKETTEFQPGHKATFKKKRK